MNDTSWTRRLPRSNISVAGESLPGYLLNLAHRLDLTPADVIKRTGLKTLDRVSLLDLSFSVTLPPDAAARFGHATGLTEDQVTGLTVDGIGPVLDMARPGKRIARSNYGNKWVNPGRTRACPDCLLEAPHPTWKTHWLTPWAVACTTHGALLIDQCPRCDIPLGEAGPGTIRSLILSIANPVEHPAACRRTSDGDMCNFRFDHATSTPAATVLLTLQERLNKAIRTPGADSNQWLRELRLIVLLLQAIGTPNDIPTTPYSEAVDAAHAMRGPETDRKRDNSVPPAATDVMAGLLLAADHLITNARGSDRLAILNRTASQHTTAWKQTKTKSGPSPALYEAMHRHQRRTTRPERLANYLPPTAGLTSAHIPAYLPPALFQAHLADARQPSGATGQHSRYERPLRRYASIAIAMHVDQIDATSAGRQLGYPDSLTAVACARASQAFRDLGGEPELFRRISVITQHFATTPRVNYQARRRYFDADWRIPEHEWATLQTALERQNRAWQVRHVDYSAWIWRRITSSDPFLTPMSHVAGSARRPGRDHRRWGKQTLAYLDDLATRFAEVIDTEAAAS